MKSINNTFVPAVLIAGAILVLAIVLLFKPFQTAFGSVAIGNDYQGTTTVSTPGAFPVEARLQNYGGSLGSVVLTGATTGTINIYDATTSDVTKRTPGQSTSTILLASFPASAATGDYVFDRVFFNGLYIVTTGTIPTTTITYR